MPSRRKICSKVCLTVVVPAPEEPVTEMMGCRADIASRSPQARNRPRCPKRGERSPFLVRPRAVVGDALDLLAVAEDERHALVQRLGLEVEDARPAVGRGAARLLDEERDRVGLVDEPQAAVQVAGPRVARVEEDAAAGEDAVGLGDQRGDPAHVEVLRRAARRRRPGSPRRRRASAGSQCRAFEPLIAYSRAPAGMRTSARVSTKLPLRRSRTKACTPWREGEDQRGMRPVDDEAGRELGAAAAGRTPRSSAGRTEKMVPIETLVSMLEEPSSGSIATARLASSRRTAGSGCSSEAQAATGAARSASRNMPSARTSSACCASPSALRPTSAEAGRRADPGRSRRRAGPRWRRWRRPWPRRRPARARFRPNLRDGPAVSTPWLVLPRFAGRTPR